MDCSLPGSSVHGILQARIMDWIAMLSSKWSSRPRDRACISCIFCIVGRFFTAEPQGKPFHPTNYCNFLKSLSYTFFSVNLVCYSFLSIFSILLLLSHCSLVLLCAALWTAAHQAPLSAGFSRQEYWSGLPFLLHSLCSSH